MLQQYPFDVFVSYAREDQSFARTLVHLLRQARRSVWFDIERVPAGSSTQETLNVALKESRHIILLITENWLSSEWTKWEGNRFAKGQKDGLERRIVPIVRVPFDDERIPYYLNGKVYLEWLEDHRTLHSWFYRLHRALEGKPAGLEENWEERGYALITHHGPTWRPRTKEELGTWAASAIQKSAPEEVLQVLSFDRDSQWGRLAKKESAPFDEAFFVLGKKGEDHEMFMARIQHCLPSSSEPPRHVIVVRWDDVPTHENHFREYLAEALAVSPDALARTLGNCLMQFSIVLLHRPVCKRDFDLNSGALRYYYTEYIPALLEEVDQEIIRLRGSRSQRWGLKVVQALAWSPSPWRILAAVLARMGYEPYWVQDNLEKARVKRLLHEIQTGIKNAEHRFSVYSLEELRLKQIQDAHLAELANKIRSRIKSPEAFPKRVRRGVYTSNMLFDRILEELGLERTLG